MSNNSNQIKCYQLSTEADQDLVDIFDFSRQLFGENQSIAYLGKLEECFNTIVFNPEIGRHRKDIQLGLRSLSYASHYIFYRIQDDYIRIVRVLHGSRDLPKCFE